MRTDPNAGGSPGVPLVGPEHVKEAAVLASLVVTMGSLICAPVPDATPRYYADQDVTSPDGRYRLTAVSPDNEGEHPRPFADDFVYTLTDTETGAEIYQRTQPDTEGSPMSVYLDDSGWCVAYTSRERLVAISPRDGSVRLQTRILDHFTDHERDTYVHWTTAGPRWTEGSRWWFLVHEDRTHFVMRPWWERAVVLDLTRERIVEEPGSALSEAIDADMRSWAVKMVRAGVEDAHGAKDWKFWRQVRTAAIVAGRQGLRDAIPDLKQLEQDTSQYSCSFTLTLDEESDGWIDPFGAMCEMQLRQAAQLSLRRLGETPRRLPGVVFRPVGAEGYLPTGEHETDPALGLARVEPGMIAKQVLHLAGGPDLVRRNEWIWEYDLDGDDPATAVVKWTPDGTVESVTRGPPAWLVPNERDERLYLW